jgi:hypothetical protein
MSLRWGGESATLSKAPWAVWGKMGNSVRAVPSRTAQYTTAFRALGSVGLIAMVVSMVVAAPPAVSASDASPLEESVSVGGPSETDSSPCGPDVNAIVCENAQPGVTPSEWDIEGAGDPSIQGFATDISVDAGQRIDFKIDTDAAAYDIEIYRTGWYQGKGARKIDDVVPSAMLPQAQDECLSDVTTELYDCGTWDVSASWDVPADAVSGVYLARLERADTGGASHIIFIVRRDGNTSDVLFQTSDPTWQAYNSYGGSNFYRGAANGRGYKLSYNRPFATRQGVENRDFYFSSEFATVRFLERNGYDMSYIAGVDTDRRGEELLGHQVFLSVGHDEYWSAGQRANIEAARDAGVNMQFLSGNEAYWHTRYEPSTVGEQADYRTLVSYKETWGDSTHKGGGKIDTSTTEWTGTWRDPRFADAAEGGASPENAITGTMYMVNHDDLPVTVTADEGDLRLWRSTGLGDLPDGTSEALAPHTVGYESNEDIDNGHRPEGLIRLSTTVGYAKEYLLDYGNDVAEGETTHHVTLYRAASGALVFSAGSVQWGWGLDETHDGEGAPADPRMQQAEVNLLADMGVQPAALMEGLVPATESEDETAPTVTIDTPVQGAQVAHGSLVTVTGTASDSGGGVVAGVEVSTDGGIRWHPAQGTDAWSYSYIQQAGGAEESVQVRAIDDSANFPPVGTSRALSVTGPYSAFGEAIPTVASADDTDAVEVGLRFTPERDGFIDAVRFYKGPENSGTHTGSLWDAAGARLGSVVFEDETATGWQAASFPEPLPVQAGTTYTVSYTAPAGGYAAQPRYWPYNSAPSSPVSVSNAIGADAAGVHGAPGARPELTWNDTNYFVDVVFTTAATSPLRIAARTPAPGVSSVAPDAPVTASFTRAADPASVDIVVRDASGAAAAGSVTYDSATKTARFTPSAPYAPSTVYTVAVSAETPDGDALEGGGWSFTTRAADRAEGDCPCSLYDESRTPAIPSDADGARVTVGVSFTPETDGTITAIKFYKGGAGNSGAHTGTIWDAAGRRLADADFSGESVAGWQTAVFGTPVPVRAGEGYVASYLAPRGGYSATAGAYATAYTRGPLSVPQRGGAYTYADGFPGEASDTDYGVDVVFEPAGATAPSVTALSPQDGASAIPATSAASATFSAPVRESFTGAVTAGGAAVAGSWARSTDGTTVTFTPAAAYAAGAHVVVSLSGLQSADGIPAADLSWSFTVAGGAAALTLLGDRVPETSTPVDGPAVELGMAFTPAVAGQVQALRYYASVGDIGAHTGSLWDAAGRRLAQVSFPTPTAAGWQRAVLSSAVDLAAGQTYTVSYFSERGRYAYTTGGFGASITSGPLTAPSPENGRYRYGAGDTAPSLVWESTNYFADVEFVPAAPSPEPTEPTEPAADAQTLFGTTVPEVASVTDTLPVEVGTAFQVTDTGLVSALRFYQGPGNTGAHRGTLWDEDGTVLARVVFPAESSTGWKRTALDAAVEVVPGKTYVVSYLSPGGGYSYTSGYFWTARTSGSIVGPAGENGRYLYASDGGKPTGSWESTSYFVDAEIDFASDGPD